MKLQNTIDQIAIELNLYSKTLDAESSAYWVHHEERFKYITHLVSDLIDDAQRPGSKIERVLDIGNSYQTMMINRIWPGLHIDTMGFLAERYRPRGETKHYDYDLNDAHYPERWISLEKNEKYDLILFLEVIEHLYTAPEKILDFLGSILNPGGLIVIQTPNAASLIKRLRLLFGENPYERIRTDRMNPGHFREYTEQEIRDIAKHTGFTVKALHMTDYFVEITTAEKICRKISKILPPTFKTGMTVVLRML